MRLPNPLLSGRLVRRYKRFLADVELSDGRRVTAHCPNPGSMLGLDVPGAKVWLSPARTPGRKLSYSWELVKVGRHLVGVNTTHPNRIVEEGIRAGRVPELDGYATLRREVAYGRNSRIDLLLEAPNRPLCYVEVKNVHLKRGPLAEFPDAVTRRGAKHVEELADMVAAGFRAVILFLVQRQDCDGFAVATDIDPEFARALGAARARGVEAVCYCCRLTTRSITLDRSLPLHLSAKV